MNAAALRFAMLLVLVLNPGAVRSLAQVRPSENLQIQLSKLIGMPSSLLFLVHLKNVGDQDLMLNLGTMLGNGQKQYLDAIHFSLKGNSGDVLSLDLIGPAIVGGRVDPLIVPLPAGAEYTLPLDLHKYCACKQGVWELKPLHGHYALQANYQGTVIPQNGTNLDMRGVALLHLWTGSIRSQTLSFYSHKEQVRPTHH